VRGCVSAEFFPATKDGNLVFVVVRDHGSAMAHSSFRSGISLSSLFPCTCRNIEGPNIIVKCRRPSEQRPSHYNKKHVFPVHVLQIDQSSKGSIARSGGITQVAPSVTADVILVESLTIIIITVSSPVGPTIVVKRRTSRTSTVDKLREAHGDRAVGQLFQSIGANVVLIQVLIIIVESKTSINPNLIIIIGGKARPSPRPIRRRCVGRR